jgi:hypothetical protein
MDENRPEPKFEGLSLDELAAFALKKEGGYHELSQLQQTQFRNAFAFALENATPEEIVAVSPTGLFYGISRVLSDFHSTREQVAKASAAIANLTPKTLAEIDTIAAIILQISEAQQHDEVKTIAEKISSLSAQEIAAIPDIGSAVRYFLRARGTEYADLIVEKLSGLEPGELATVGGITETVADYYRRPDQILPLLHRLALACPQVLETIDGYEKFILAGSHTGSPEVGHLFGSLMLDFSPDYLATTKTHMAAVFRALYMCEAIDVAEELLKKIARETDISKLCDDNMIDIVYAAAEAFAFEGIRVIAERVLNEASDDQLRQFAGSFTSFPDVIRHNLDLDLGDALKIRFRAAGVETREPPSRPYL